MRTPHSRREGYFLIDHSASPGVTPEFLASAGLDPSLAVPGGVKFEAAAMTCSHCQSQIIRNPARTRERAYCRSCDQYICDPCGARMQQTLTCDSVARRVDDYMEAAVRGHLPILDGEHR